MKEPQSHTCDRIPRLGVDIRLSGELRTDDTQGWVLSIHRIATEQDLEENHYLEEEGELIWETVVEIQHCPFCGVALPAADTDASNLTVQHFDHSGWSVKVG